MDENYEWDSEFPGDMELLETLHLGLAGPRSRLEAEPELGVRAFQKGRHPWPHCPTPPALGLSLFPARPSPLTASPLTSSALAGPRELRGTGEPQEFTQGTLRHLPFVLRFAGVKTPEEGCLLSAAHAPGPEARCAALREEFLAFRRRRDAARSRLPAYRQHIFHPEQATLL